MIFSWRRRPADHKSFAESHTKPHYNINMLFAQGLRRFCANKIAPSKHPRQNWQIRPQNNVSN